MDSCFYFKLLVDYLVIHLINSFLVVGLAWNPETRVVWYISILGVLTSLEMVLGIIVEVTTCIYLKSVCVDKRKTIRWRDMGRYEISSTIGTWINYCWLYWELCSRFYPLLHRHFSIF